MSFTRSQEMPSWIRTNLLWVVIVNIGLIVLYVSVSYRLQTSDTVNSEYRYVHINPLSHSSVQFLNVSTIKVLSSDCPGLPFPVLSTPEVTWHPVDGNRSAFVYSVYSVKRLRKIIIIGAKERNKLVYYCQLWYKENNDDSLIMKQWDAQSILLPEGHGKRYSATLFECLLTSSEIPVYVSVVSESCAAPLHPLRVDANLDTGTRKRRFTVCLNPLNTMYSNVFGLVEWIELNRILGAEKFIVYNYSSAVNVKRLLQYYSERGITEVVQWQLPMNEEANLTEDKSNGIHYFGQIAALHDCLYRNKRNSEFIVNIDLDEFIIPRAGGIYTWSDMVTLLNKLKRKAVSAYLIRNAFFRTEWTSENITTLNTSLTEKYHLLTLQKIEREHYIFPPAVRSKYFARTSTVSNVMVHVVSGVAETDVMAVSPAIGLLHHYRNCEDLSNPSNSRVTDKTVIDKYGASLLRHISDLWSDIENII